WQDTQPMSVGESGRRKRSDHVLKLRRRRGRQDRQVRCQFKDRVSWCWLGGPFQLPNEFLRHRQAYKVTKAGSYHAASFNSSWTLFCNVEENIEVYCVHRRGSRQRVGEG